MTSSSNYLTTRIATLSAGLTSASRNLKTKQDPSYTDNPSVFTFTPITTGTKNQEYISNTITLTGMSIGASNTVTINGNATAIYKNGSNV